MASDDQKDKMTCSVCSKAHRDPVTLTCGHSFCQICIDKVLDSQEGPRRCHRCPECRAEFDEIPLGKKKIKLCNVVNRFPSTQPTKAQVCCTYCVQIPVPAAKSCLLCEASLCEIHLRVHSKAAEHILVEPTTSFVNIKCSVHNEIMKYYCTKDGVCICVSCRLDGGHSDHQVEPIHVASEKKKEKLKKVLEKVSLKRHKADKRLQILQGHKKEVKVKAAGVTERVTALIRDIRGQLETLEKQVLSEISRQEEQVSIRVSDLIRPLEIKKDKLSMQMGHIKELCNMSDPLKVLQEQEFKMVDYGDADEQDEVDGEYGNIHAVGELNVGLILQTLHTGFGNVATGVLKWNNILEASDKLLDENMAADFFMDVNTELDIKMDVNTASNDVTLSEDLKTVSWTDVNQRRPETKERFHNRQALSSTFVTSGRHYFEVDTSESGEWRLGMAYSSIERIGNESIIGYNNKSWTLWRCKNKYSARHDRKVIQLPYYPSCHRLVIYLDYEAGRLSFYELGEPIRDLHTFSATFTEPLHVAFAIGKDAWLRARN
uniref:Uncharacterized protein n=1 Tax=Leptobrachium leishanense TaxID=445787 RepID=A0A8C5M7B9_9ANUR